MQHTSLARRLFGLSSLLLLAGCGATLPNTSLSPTSAVTFSGRVHGGEQPVSGATIQLYTVGTAGDGSAAFPLLSSPVTSDANGNFNITGLYSCSAATEVYLLATGGNPGLSAPNPNLALMTALGPCTALTPQSFISVNELTTVAAIYALSPYMTDATHLGSATSDAPALAAAFGLAGQLVSPSTGIIQNASLAPQLNLLADLAAACVNSTGGISNSTVCGQLFGLTFSSSGTSPRDTVAALLDIAQNPNNNVQQLYQLIPASAPYQPTPPTAPADLSISRTPSANVASGLQIGPSTLTFPSTTVGATAPAQTLVISNATTSAIALNSIGFTGANPADFAQTNTCGSSLAAFTTCTVTITFTPGGTSTRNASLSIASATLDSPQVVALSGTGRVITYNGPHAVVDNPVVRIYPGASYDVNLSNTGTTSLAISSIALGGTPFNTQINNCPTSLDPGASCTITIRSIAAGADQLTILTNDPGFTSSILVFQASNAPAAVFTPSDVFFAGTQVASTSRYSFVYNQNAVVTPAISGPQASEFTTTPAGCSQTSIYAAPLGCTLTIAFTPSASGLRSAKLNLDSSGNYIPLAGIGTNETQISTSFSFRYFPYYPVPQSITFTNTSSSTISAATIGIQSITGSPEFTQTNNCGSTLAPNASCTIVVTTTRFTEGGTQALLTLTAGTNLYTLPLDNSVFPVINFGDTASTSTPGVQQAAYPILPSQSNYSSYYSYFSMNQEFLADYPWPFFSLAPCSTTTGTCVGELNYNPTQLGLQVGTLEVSTTSDGYGAATGISTRQYIVVGTGVATEPAAKLFLQQSGFTSIAHPYAQGQGTLTLINPGPHTLNITGPALSGSAPQNFTLGQASCSQPSTSHSTYPAIAQGTSCSIPITFNNTQTGLSAAVATLTDNTSGLTFSTPLYVDTLAGPALSPSSLGFGSVADFSVTPPQSVTVTRDISHPVTSSTSGNLIAVKGSCAAGETPCVLTFAFAPTALTDTPAAIVSDTTLGISTTLPVTGTPHGIVVYSTQRVSAQSIYFPTQATGTISTSRTITLTSAGPNALNIYSIDLAGTNASEFTETNNCPAILPVNATCAFSISFAPASVGFAKAATLTLKTSADPGEPLAISLSGAAQ